MKLDGISYVFNRVKNAKINWDIASIMPTNNVSITALKIITIGVLLLNGILLFIGTVFLSRFITTPIKELLKSMKGVGKREFTTVSVITVTDEVGELKEGYNTMIDEINRLITEIIKEQRIKRLLELNVLQEQIKPHFLYNTFDAIKSFALLGDNAKVYSALKELGRFYRTSLSNGREVITIAEELQTVKSYMALMELRYGDYFSVKYDLDENANNCRIIRLVLQPLVENAIYHGIKPNGSKGTISIISHYNNDNIIIIIEDDGIGMKQDTINSILNGGRDERPGIGLKGTIDRLRIFYGIDNLMKINSIPGSSKESSMEKVLRNKTAICVFVLPALILYIGIVMLPIFLSFYYSLYKWDGQGAGIFTGFGNYIRLFQSDSGGFAKSVLNSFILAALSVFIQIPIAMVLALTLSRGIKGESFFRTVYFIPVIVSTVVIGELFKKIYHPDYGLLNVILRALGLDSLSHQWLGDPKYALIAVFVPIVWQYIMIFMAAT